MNCAEFHIGTNFVRKEAFVGYNIYIGSIGGGIYRFIVKNRSNQSEFALHSISPRHIRDGDRYSAFVIGI